VELGHHTLPEVAVRVDEIADATRATIPTCRSSSCTTTTSTRSELIEEICAFSNGPVVAVAHAGGPRLRRRAARLGIHSYARQETRTSMQSAIEIALRRWEERRALRDDLQRLQSALERRALIRAGQGHPDGASRRRRGGGVRAHPRARAQPQPHRGRRRGIGARGPRAAPKEPTGRD